MSTVPLPTSPSSPLVATARASHTSPFIPVPLLFAYASSSSPPTSCLHLFSQTHPYLSPLLKAQSITFSLSSLRWRFTGSIVLISRGSASIRHTRYMPVLLRIHLFLRCPLPLSVYTSCPSLRSSSRNRLHRHRASQTKKSCKLSGSTKSKSRATSSTMVSRPPSASGATFPGLVGAGVRDAGVFPDSPGA
ncbi:hypothetical protein MVEN_01402400 [Mycena venus]|uniref:Uncharacterized protein n=1 Tax=Mycena venus TaxID=2733690 RepID=A0A8H6XY03_9AGAR|nr:hypothetical protein MVEN_01402400 [Mycena venus]